MRGRGGGARARIFALTSSPDRCASLRAQGIIASTTPYRSSYARLAPSLLNDEAELERTLSVIRSMA